MWLPELLLVAFVPGALLFRAPVLQRDRRAALTAEERVFWAAVISAAWTSVVALALAAASAYTFPRLLAVNGALSLAALAWWRTRLLYRGAAAAPGRTALFPAALVLLGLVVFFPVSEFVIGGKDPGVYVNEGHRARPARVVRDHRHAGRGGAAGPAGHVLPAVPGAVVLQHPLHGVLPRRSHEGHGRRAVPAPLPGVGGDRVRPRRGERRVEGGRRVVDLRPRRGVLPRRAALRTVPRVVRVGPARALGGRGLVRALPELGDAAAGPGVRRPAGVRPVPRGRRPVLRAGGRRRSRVARVRAVRRGAGVGGGRRRRRADAVPGTTAPRLVPGADGRVARRRGGLHLHGDAAGLQPLRGVLREPPAGRTWR